MARQRLLIFLLIACLCVSAVAFGYPMYVIRPFRPQGASELQLALVIRSWAPWIGTTAAAISAVVLLVTWRAIARAMTRSVAVVAAMLTVCFAALTYVNVFEMMFHPIPSPGQMAAAEAKLDPDEMVLAVHISGQARAYPILMMGYHHIANDWVGGQPIVATY